MRIDDVLVLAWASHGTPLQRVPQERAANVPHNRKCLQYYANTHTNSRYAHQSQDRRSMHQEPTHGGPMGHLFLSHVALAMWVALFYVKVSSQVNAYVWRASIYLSFLGNQVDFVLDQLCVWCVGPFPCPLCRGLISCVATPRCHPWFHPDLVSV